jgi:hypothetical protein
MAPDETLTRKRLKTPRAAAIAGLVFSCLLAVALRFFVSQFPRIPRSRALGCRPIQLLALAMNLIPFAGIVFLWFIGDCAIALVNLKTAFFHGVLR